MTLTLEETWVWDLWLAPEKVDGDWHIFFLQAPRSLINPDLRHANATVGHATSPDLINWQYVGTALEPSAHGAWDDRAIWTGSIIKSDAGVWHMFYTGTNKSKENGFVQRIGVATSTDLMSWDKKEGFVTEADARWYEKAAQVMEEKQEGQSSWYEEAWRDPWVFKEASTGEWVMLITARSNTGSYDARGTIGVARSKDLLQWQVCEPLKVESEFGHYEVPQLMHSTDSELVISFCLAANNHAATRVARGERTWTGNGIMRASTFDGVWKVENEPFLEEPHYAARIIHDEERLLAIAWLNFVGADFQGYIDNPIDVTNAFQSTYGLRIKSEGK
ncbi:MAG: glycosyl hydrolase family 32 [Actinobacteria bacterium]|uniref:beta-fructofuranosidase n=1 Tax=freshwater metagenome TaxID=449393 RepID=A0A6J7B138_9ZZZZ|nr:glycosyl hydrolase family 32 [Actinomycetota bacterium]MSY35507.1 glycosyl hydrolase family 32 [Actinomycetota bacterium]MTA71964.1 glycosyl hydrolase family 32 [Actinomycetota bacterium]MTB29150.1 glycosyl hydrolase family 32 [Actinomycetota bacterium]MUH48863.1 glycosyl hydrolase family 32 [Actinomycetota bacterium]